jgi:hypothetical protein
LINLLSKACTDKATHHTFVTSSTHHKTATAMQAPFNPEAANYKFEINGHAYYSFKTIEHTSANSGMQRLRCATIYDAAGSVVAKTRSKISYERAWQSAKRKTELYACELVSSPAQAVSDADMLAPVVVEGLKGYDAGPHVYTPAQNVSIEAEATIEKHFQENAGQSMWPCAVCGLPCEMCEGSMPVAGEPVPFSVNDAVAAAQLEAGCECMGDGCSLCINNDGSRPEVAATAPVLINRKRKYYKINASTGDSQIRIEPVLKEERQKIEEAYNVVKNAVAQFEKLGYKFPAFDLATVKDTHRRGIAFSLNSAWNEETDKHMMISTYCMYPGIENE